MPPVAASPPGSEARELLRRLELDVTRRLDGLLQGDYRGLVAGLGSEPGEARGYVAGDDVRRMDWNVTARMNTPHVRDTVADRELFTNVLVDMSASLDFGTAQRTKRDLAVAAVAAVGLLTDRVGNRFGAITITGEGVTEHRAGSGRRHLLGLLHNLVTADTTRGRTDLATGLLRLASPSRRPGLAVVISDLLADDWHGALRRVTSRHEALVIEVIDPRELDLPAVGVIELVDAETGELREVDTRRSSTREAFARASRQRRDEHARLVRSAGADHLVLRTDRDWVVDLARFVDRRRRGRRVARSVPPR